MSRPPSRPSERRSRGLYVEDRACDFLREHGFEILARNHASKGGEVDVVAGKGELLVFVEVRSRGGDSFGTPAETVSPAKRRRVIAAATDFAVRHGLWDSRAIRFDVLGVLDRGDELAFEHLEGAFDATGAAT